MAIFLATQRHLREAQRKTFCYLCTRAFVAGDTISRDHVVARTLFAVADRTPPLILPTHVVCNGRRSAEDEAIGQLVGVLHGRPMVPQGRRMPEVVGGSFPDGTHGVGVRGLNLKTIILRWVRGFHAALYNAPLGHCDYLVLPPMPEGREVGGHVEAVAVPQVVPDLVEELRRNRATGTLDAIVFGNGRCRYECVWSQADGGQRFCAWGLDLYGWRDLGDPQHFEPRGCVGTYRPRDGVVPATAALATRLVFDVPRGEPLDPFGPQGPI